MHIFLAERTFCRIVLERLNTIAILLAERNLAFRRSNKTFGSAHNGSFVGLFKLLTKRFE